MDEPNPPEAVRFGRLITALNDAKLEFVVVGGVALWASGYVRATEDLDVLVSSEVDQMRVVRSALEKLNATRPDGSPLPEWLFDGSHVIHCDTPTGLLDVLMDGDPPLSFPEVKGRASPVEIGGTEALVCNLEDLVRLKRLADRSIDRHDLEMLEQVHGRLPD